VANQSSGQLRKAASLIAVRDTPSGPQILVLERGAGSRFLPGYVAFPGGAIDELDPQLALRWFSDRDESARAASIRELVEEAGLAVTSSGLVESLSEAPIDQSPPSADQLPQIAHWIAPEQVPVRFDARFFAVASAGGLTPTPDGGETAAAWWVSPLELLDQWEARERKLYWPTYFTMTHLARCADAAHLMGLRFETREPTDEEEAALPRSVFEQD
jgi:8-oxo-dGTP pyrophosphatase MutT (NUDIX family)